MIKINLSLYFTSQNMRRRDNKSLKWKIEKYNFDILESLIKIKNKKFTNLGRSHIIKKNGIIKVDVDFCSRILFTIRPT